MDVWLVDAAFDRDHAVQCWLNSIFSVVFDAQLIRFMEKKKKAVIGPKA